MTTCPPRIGRDALLQWIGGPVIVTDRARLATSARTATPSNVDPRCSSVSGASSVTAHPPPPPPPPPPPDEASEASEAMCASSDRKLLCGSGSEMRAPYEVARWPVGATTTRSPTSHPSQSSTWSTPQPSQSALSSVHAVRRTPSSETVPPYEMSWPSSRQAASVAAHAAWSR